METKKQGAQTFALASPPSLAGFASIAGKKEGQGPLRDSFDLIEQDTTFGESTWEKAESAMQQLALEKALEKAKQPMAAMDLLFAGDLLNQCIAAGYSARKAARPFFGLYGACSTMGEALALAAMALDGGFGEWAAAVVSSHFCTAERQYRTPLEYGGQRTPTAQWTATAAGAAVLARAGEGPYLTHVTVGKINDMGIKDANNMGAAMAPAACDTLRAHFADTGRTPEDYDLILTGDLGMLGRQLCKELLQREGIDLSDRYNDCGCLLYDVEAQDVHCGASGCGCSASVLCGLVLNGMRAGKWNRVLFCPTGALHSPVSLAQGESIPGICHAIALSNTIQ
ncbi:MAG: stage V sporulation protein AD [Clostridiales bacterium]|nr:stage V sporulation protein AD [Clostridiales bacterium]